MRLLEERKSEAPSETTISTGFEIVSAALDKEPETRPATRDFYRNHLRPWIEALGADRLWRAVTFDEVQRIVDRWRETIGPQTIRHRLGAATRVVRLLGLQSNPFDRNRLSLPRQRRQRREDLSWPEVLDMLRKLRDTNQRTELVVLGTIAGFGLRRAEFARLRRRHFDLRSGFLRISADVGKTGPRDLPIPKTKDTRILIEDLLDL